MQTQARWVHESPQPICLLVWPQPASSSSSPSSLSSSSSSSSSRARAGLQPARPRWIVGPCKLWGVWCLTLTLGCMMSHASFCTCVINLSEYFSSLKRKPPLLVWFEARQAESDLESLWHLAVVAVLASKWYDTNSSYFLPALSRPKPPPLSTTLPCPMSPLAIYSHPPANLTQHPFIGKWTQFARENATLERAKKEANKKACIRRSRWGCQFTQWAAAISLFMCFEGKHFSNPVSGKCFWD